MAFVVSSPPQTHRHWPVATGVQAQGKLLHWQINPPVTSRHVQHGAMFSVAKTSGPSNVRVSDEVISHAAKEVEKRSVAESDTGSTFGCASA